MYEHFYKVQKNPFEITPDPAFLFTTTKHNSALATLYYGVKRHKGFVVLTGEVGTGKTLIVRCLLSLLKLSNVHYAYVFNPKLGALEFLQYIVGDLRLAASNNKSELLLTLSRFAIENHRKGHTTMLIVDESHHLSKEVLEEIRLLTNLETANDKLMQILLVGQPELDDKLDSLDLRQLKQRIAVRYHIAPLDLEETGGYIQRRLKVAGNPNPQTLFPEDAVQAIHRHSKGIPRLINTLCENALIAGYASQAVQITPRMIDEIAMEFRLNVVSSQSKTESTASGRPAAEIEAAAKTLLDLYASLRNAQSKTQAVAAPTRTFGARQNESFI
jgi:general secretion pathway protein A